MVNQEFFEHGDKKITGCNNCTCIDGSFKCNSIICPLLPCPKEKQITEANECCNYCQGETPHEHTKLLIYENNLFITFENRY